MRKSAHVAFVSFVGLRVREQELLALGITLPGLGDRKGAVAELPALGLLSLAGYMPAGWTCSYHETDCWTDALVDRIVSERPSLVAVSALTAGVLESYAFSSKVRERGVATILGGLHATACPEEALLHFDAVVVGDGEPAWNLVLADAYAGSLGGVYRTAPFDLSESRPPRFDLVANAARSRYTIQTQRGCPLACEFCAASRLLGGFREKPAALVQAELDALQQIVSSPVVEFADDNTFAGGRNPAELLKVFGDAGIRYFTESDWRIGERPDLLRHLAASGCVQVLIGIESLVHNYRGLGAKQADHSRVMAALGAIQDSGVAVIGCFVVGADGETFASIARLTQFLLDCPLADVQVTLQTPFPGSPLYRNLRRAGRILAHRDWSYYTLFDVAFVPDCMTVEALENAYRELTSVVYSASEANRRFGIRRKIWAKAKGHVQCG